MDAQTVLGEEQGLRVEGDEPRPIIVALVCSAGGLHALREVLRPLPGTFPAAVIVLQHQPPGRPSQLAPLLQRTCALPVHSAVNGSLLEGGTVVVIPPGSHAVVTRDDHIALFSTDGPPPYRPSADLLLTSLAVVAPSRSIAVILSGEGKDGATGATALHDLGGFVLAADETSSEHFAMPAAAISRDEVVDRVLPVEQIAPLLCQFVEAGRARSYDSTLAGREPLHVDETSGASKRLK